MFSHKNTTYCPRLVLEPRLINLESIALTMRSPSLPQRCKQFGCKIQGENGFQKVRVAKVLLSTKTIQCIRFNLFETVNCVNALSIVRTNVFVASSKTVSIT